MSTYDEEMQQDAAEGDQEALQRLRENHKARMGDVSVPPARSCVCGEEVFVVGRLDCVRCDGGWVDADKSEGY